MAEFEVPLVSVNIPTLNSERTLVKCLQSVKQQTYGNVEIIVLDGGSKDSTLDLATQFGAKVLTGTSLPSRRRLGIKVSKGKHLLMLDSDQVLDPDAVSRCVEMSEKYGFDMLVLGERPIKTDTLIERVFKLDRELVHRSGRLDPVFGTLLPRFFRRDFVERADWPQETMAIMSDYHALLYYSCTRQGGRVGIAHNCLYHHDPASLKEVVFKFYGWGDHYVQEFRLNPKVTVFHALPRREYFSRHALSNPLTTVLFVVYLTKTLSGFLGALRGLAKVLGHKLRI